MPTDLRSPLTQERKDTLGQQLVLHWLCETQTPLHASLLERDDQYLEKYLNLLEDAEWIRINDTECYEVTEAGKSEYQQMIKQQKSYQTHFEVYAYVDLEAGVFADPDTDLLEDQRWEDLRVVVAEYKGIDPYQVVFLSMIADEAFFQDSAWRFDLASGEFFDELEDVIRSQVTMDELGFVDEEGYEVSGEDVLLDVIEQGSQISQSSFND